MRALIFLLCALIASTAHAEPQTVRGVASVIDGDTFEIQGQRIRLYGVDAPESAQTCIQPDQAVWPCGRRVAAVVDQHVGRKSVVCEVRDVDRYKRLVAECFINGQSINKWLVAEGMAFAYRQYSPLYIVDEDAARAQRKGIWSGVVQAPWEYRAAGARPNDQDRARLAAEAAPAPAAQEGASPFRSCRAARAAGAAPVRAGDPGYSRKLDRDGDGVGCE